MLIYQKSGVNSNILYFKDLFDENGVFLNENIIVQRLVRTDNWMIEYLIVKNVFYHYATNLTQVFLNISTFTKSIKIIDFFIKISSIALMIWNLNFTTLYY